MLGKIWNRTLFLQGIKYFLSFFLLIFVFYIFIDFFIHSSRIGKAGYIEIIFYYLSQIILSFEIFIPLAFLLAIIKVFSTLTVHKESLAYQIAGLSKIRLMSPFFFIALLLLFFSLFSLQVLVPRSARVSQAFESAYLLKSPTTKTIQSIELQNQSKLIYQRYNKEKKQLLDVFWILSFDDIWHIETLEIDNVKTGFFVDHFIREKDLLLKKAESFDRYIFQAMPFHLKDLEMNMIPYEYRPLSKLIFQDLFSSKEEQIKLQVQLHKKIALSFLPILILFCTAPFCLNFSRRFSPFFITGVSLFSFAFFFALSKALLLLCESQVLSPLIGCWLLPICLLILGSFKTFCSR